MKTFNKTKTDTTELFQSNQTLQILTQQTHTQIVPKQTDTKVNEPAERCQLLESASRMIEV